MDWRGDLEVNTGQKSFVDAMFYYFTSPSFAVVQRYRWYARLYRSKLPLANVLRKLLWLSNTRVGAYISPKATIGKNLCLPHPVGVVIGEGAEIGDNVTIYQGTTIGVSGVNRGRYPVVADNVVIYANATLIGDITIGDHAVVGANSVVTRDVQSGTVVVGAPAGPIASGAPKDERSRHSAAVHMT